ncbi:uncharacterized protein LOC120074268 isoform X1 [Benincasa hispida]|uniref:uncharacterized protein LOC120074268 isoform X1 n=1 Tax=Benincasa hispida TaxID=102211 RepID=UPI00190269EE|nr:uncharacterized protein LOC120074268 isoform X1 [Benincasa hispida]
MALSSLPNFIHFPNSFSISNSNNLNVASIHSTTNSYLPPPLSAKRRPSLCVKCHGSPELENKDDDDDDPLETINKLYKGIKKKDIADLSNVIANRRPDIFNSIPFLQTNLKMWSLMSNIIKGLQDSLVFSVQPTTKDGSMVGIKWKVGWHKPLMESKEGVSIHSHHSYVGKLLIGNFEMLLDPLLQLGPMKTMKWIEASKSKERRIASLCLGFFLLLVSLFCLQFSVR